MRRVIDLTGQQFGRLTVLYREPNKRNFGRAHWWCQCDCGTMSVVEGANLRNGNTQSCGCLQRERRIEKATIHGGTGTPMYNLWMNIKERCDLPSNRDYPEYGGRGIRCEFASFTEFLHTMGEKPGPQYSLGRIDNDGPYSPTNCSWQTAKEQANNRRGNVRITFKGEIRTVAGWADHLHLRTDTLWRRLYVYHWPLARALTEPLHPKAH